MGMSFGALNRQAAAAARVTSIGTGAIGRIYSGSRPASAAAAPTGTLLATLTWTGVNIGTATGGVITINTAGATQTAASHVSGTPGYMRVLRSDGTTVEFDIDLNGSAPTWTFTGTVVTGQNITFPTAPTLTEF